MSSKNKDPFKFIKAINKGEDIEVDNDFNSFLTNRAFSYHLDTLAVANYCNLYPKMSPQMHFDYLKSTVSVGNRFSKWYKPKANKDANILAKYFGISLKQAYDQVYLYSPEELTKMSNDLEGIKDE